MSKCDLAQMGSPALSYIRDDTSSATRRAVVELMKSVLVLPYNYGTTGKSLYTHAVKTSFEYRELELLLKSELKTKAIAVPYDPEFHKIALQALQFLAQFLAATIKPMKTHAPIAKYAVPTGIDVYKEQHLETTTQANTRKKKSRSPAPKRVNPICQRTPRARGQTRTKCTQPMQSS
jgi:hypothetical protein